MQKTLALVLKKQNWRETDRLITFFSPTLGKRRGLAKAARKPLSKLAGHLDTFMVSQLILTDDPEWPSITSAQLVEPFEQLRGSLTKLDHAFAVSKIIERVALENVNQQTLFQLTLDALARLNSDELPWSAVWLSFLGSLTAQLGIDITDFHCHNCQKPIDGPANWNVDEQKFTCSNCLVGGPTIILLGNSVKLLRLVQQRPYRFIAQLKVEPTVAAQTEEVLLREITRWFNKPWSNYAALKEL